MKPLTNKEFDELLARSSFGDPTPPTSEELKIAMDQMEEWDREDGMKEKSKKGFASMDKERQRQVASMGGKAASKNKNRHRFTPEEARIAGKKGGQRVIEMYGRDHMSEIGKKGGATLTSERAAEIGRKGGATKAQNEHPDNCIHHD